MPCMQPETATEGSQMYYISKSLVADPSFCLYLLSYPNDDCCLVHSDGTHDPKPQVRKQEKEQPTKKRKVQEAFVLSDTE